jgi:predicted amidohydrolase
MLTVGYFQFAPVFGDIELNIKQVLAVLKHTNAEVVVLPELPFTGYNFKDRNELSELAEEPEKSHVVEELIDLCKKKRFHIVTGFAEKAGDKIYNSALLLSHRGIKQVYRKLHLFGEEKKYFDAGDKAPEICKAGKINIGMMVCYDWIFPEVARCLSLQGADLICHPSNLVLNLCQQTMIGRAIENGVYVITANRHGKEKRAHGEISFTGQSQIVNPRGEVLRKAPEKTNELYVCQISEIQSRNKNVTPSNNVFEDRRPEFYKSIVTIKNERSINE